MKQIPKPIVNKLSRYVLLTMLVVMIVVLALSFRICYHAVRAESHVRYVGMMNVASEKIANHQRYGDECKERIR